jgi:hypothetical protein
MRLVLLQKQMLVKFKAFEFRFRREPADYVPEQDFVPLIWVRRDDPDEGGDGAAEGDDDAMDTTKTRLGPDTVSSQPQQAGPSTSAPVTARMVASVIAVTPFNPNQNPNSIEAVKKLRAISPSLEGRSSSLASPQVSAEALRVALDVAAAEHSRSDRPVEGQFGLWVASHPW